VAVIGLPDERWGERVHAVVVLHPGSNAGEADIVAHAKDKLAGYKRPRTVSFIAEADMPRTATGKILRRVLRERINE
jgi:acyl-CoA synthetase (AMP-forming)/AMP-acid ligase II